MKGYDIIGNIAILKFDRKDKLKDKKRIAERFLKAHKHVKTILEKAEKFKGRLRIQKTKHLIGDRTKEALYKENNCIFRLNVDSCYFSPRLSTERKEIALKTKKGENVLVMFGGVAPFAIVIGKLGKARKIVSVELGRECNIYARENVKRNKLQSRVEVVQGDVKKKTNVKNCRKEFGINGFDRIVMPRPKLKDSFLDVAFKVVKKNGMIYYYGFYEERDARRGLKELIESEAKKAGKKIRIVKVKKAGEIGVRTYRYRADVKILN